MTNLWLAVNEKIEDIIFEGTLLGGLMMSVAVAFAIAIMMLVCAFVLVYGTYLLLR